MFPPFDIQMVPDKKNFLTWHKRPRSMDAVPTLNVPANLSEFAIVMQGAILTKADFTLETCKFYRRAFPEVEIILSTWDTEDPDVLKSIEREGVTITTSTKPLNPGISNCNLQLASTHAGLLEAERSGAKWAMKTRTDQRIYSPTALSFFQNILKLFPFEPGKNSEGSLLKHRLISVSLDTFKYRLFGLSDFLMFGQIDDMLTYWGVDLDDRLEIPNGTGLSTAREYSKKEIVEVYFMANFLRRIGWEIQWTLENYRSALANYFVVIDALSIDLYWPKYSSREHLWRNYGFSLLEPISFSDWLHYYLASTGNLVAAGEEEYLDRQI
jgi:WavE lipopolysaccharide synthesis